MERDTDFDQTPPQESGQQAGNISHRCELGDSSVTGYRIISTSNENLDVTVGDLAALKKNEQIVEKSV